MKEPPEVIGEKVAFHLPNIPGRATAVLILAAIAVVCVVVLLKLSLVYVHPTEFGIKEVKVGVDRGIHEKIYGPGFAFVLPWVEKMHRFPRGIQVLDMTAYPENSRPEKSGFFGKASETVRTERAAKIQTSDGFYVDVDVSILYKIVDAYKLITTIGSGTLYLKNGILPKAEPVLKQAFGELNTENFYNSPMRAAKAEKARDLLNAELKPKGMQVDQVLVRYFKYSDEIQKNIEEKKLQDQLVFKNQAQAKAAMEEANRKRVAQEGEMQVKVTLQEGQAYKVRKDADRELYTRRKRAEADLLVKLAEAKRTELKNEAMQVAGSDKMVAMRMAEVLGGIDTVIIPSGGQDGFNPLDLDQMLKLFGADTTAPAQPPKPAKTPPTPAVQPHEEAGQ